MEDKKIIIVTICVIILVIILYFFISHFAMIDVKIPTGNVDIFDINFIEQNDNNDNNNTSNLNDDNSKQNYDNNSSTFLGQTIGENNNAGIQNENQINREENNLTVYDNKTVYTDSTLLNIFKNKSYYVKDDVIAPESENSYQFVIRNNNDFAIIYSLEFEQINPYNINMKYRLKKGGEYIVGNDKDWVTANELLQGEVILANDSYNVYTLDWKWFESDNDTDTKIGTSIEANYSLNINIFANRY